MYLLEGLSFQVDVTPQRNKKAFSKTTRRKNSDFTAQKLTLAN